MRALRISFLALAALAALPAAEDPIRWSIEEGPRTKDVITARVKATIEEGWHLYSISQPPGGPITTRIWIAEDQPYQMAGTISGPKPYSSYDQNFSMDVEFYEGSPVFELPVKATASAKPPLRVSAYFQTCNDKLCLPPKTVKLELAVK